MVKSFLNDAEEWCASSGGKIVANGCGTARLMQVIQVLESRYGPGPRTERECRAVTVAEVIDVNRTSTPARAGLLNAANLMSPERAQVFEIWTAVFSMTRGSRQSPRGVATWLIPLTR